MLLIDIGYLTLGLLVQLSTLLLIEHSKNKKGLCPVSFSFCLILIRLVSYFHLTLLPSFLGADLQT